MHAITFLRKPSNGTGAVTGHDVKHVFLMTGAEANTGWLNGRVALDAKGFVKTGPDLTQADLVASGWPLERSPCLLETSLPGVFAAGDVRCGNVKRVVSALSLADKAGGSLMGTSPSSCF
jgi:thioredoxin reductase (NADPH)